MQPGPGVSIGPALDYRLAHVNERVQARRLLGLVSQQTAALVSLTARPHIWRLTGAIAWAVGGAFWAAVPVAWASSVSYALAAPALAAACASVGVGHVLARRTWRRRQHRRLLTARHDAETLGVWLERELATVRQGEAAAGTMMGGLCMLLPMLLHALVLLPIVGLRDFGRWVCVSMVLVTHAHLALGLTLRGAARKWADLDEQALRGDNTALVAVLVAAATALVPGVILFAIPSMLVLVTGVSIVPAWSFWMRRSLLAQRHEVRRIRDEMLALTTQPVKPEELEAFDAPPADEAAEHTTDASERALRQS